MTATGFPENFPWTRHEIQEEFCITDGTFTLWKRDGLFGPVLYTTANKRGHGRPLGVFDWRFIEELYKQKYDGVIARKKAKMFKPSSKEQYLRELAPQEPGWQYHPITGIKLYRIDEDFMPITENSDITDSSDDWDIYYLQDNRTFPDSFAGCPMTGWYIIEA